MKRNLDARVRRIERAIAAQVASQDARTRPGYVVLDEEGRPISADIECFLSGRPIQAFVTISPDDWDD